MKSKLTIYLILHNIRSVFNVGSIFRTADAFGVKKIYLVGYTPEPAQKTALGAEKYIQYEKAKSVKKILKKLKENKFFIISLENRVSGSVQINRFASLASWKKFNKSARSNKLKNVAIILGNEVRGIPKGIRIASDAVVEIPMRGKKESLNVAVAAGIALYAINNLLQK
ncbi:MAG: TrmH family RNA methyltransferase [Patescibacteria group bacterium]